MEGKVDFVESTRPPHSDGTGSRRGRSGMKLDATNLRYLTAEDFRVLKAAETGSLNHEVVPSTLIASLSGLQHAGLNKIMSDLAKRGLIAREKNIKYDGWRLTYGGYDWLAVRALREKQLLLGVGTRVGVGKESDIYTAQLCPPPGEELPPPAVLKVHRLGRISFRKIKEKRDYLGKRKSAPNWMYLSRLAAKKEWQFLQILYQHGFPVPTPVAHSRHSILMSRIDGYPLRQIVDLPEEHVASLFASLMALIVRLARAGLIHCDFNEFNIMVREVRDKDDDDEYESEKDKMTVWGTGQGLARGFQQDDEEEGEEYQLRPGERIEKGNGFERIYRVQEGDKSSDESEEDEEDSDEEESEDEETYSPDEFDESGTNEGLKITLGDGSAIEPILIDFPQMVSVEHANAEYYFDRDVECVCSFFKKRFRFQGNQTPRFRDVVSQDRQQVRESRARRRAKKAREIQEGEYVPSVEDEPLGLELDALADASGVGSSKKQVTPLEQYMATLRMQQEAATEEAGSRSEEEEGKDEAQEHEEEDDIDARLQDGTLLPPSAIEPLGRHHGRQSRRVRDTSGVSHEKDSDVKARVAAERQQRANKEAKHHGKKAHAGKAGRAWTGGAGGKAKTSDKALVFNSLHF